MVSNYGTRLPIIPDLRFEQSYLRSISGYFVPLDSEQTSTDHTISPNRADLTEYTALGESADSLKSFDEIDNGVKATRTEKGKEVEKFSLGPQGHDKSRLEGESSVFQTVPIPIQVVRLDWRGVAWVTLRDQLVSPLIQGALWGVASHFLRPALSLVGARIRLLFTTHRLPQTEGSGVGWLRRWARSWTSEQGVHAVPIGR